MARVYASGPVGAAGIAPVLASTIPSVSASPTHHRPPLFLLIAVALLSAAVLGFEVALTRVFAVLLRYHFAFLVISIALCGLGLGGYAAHWWRQRRSLSLPLLAILLGIAIDMALLLVLRVIFAHFPQAYWLAALVVLAPFTIAGVFLAEAFARYAAWSGRLYAWDLAGAALTAVAIVGLLQLVSAIDACLWMGGLACLAAVAAYKSENRVDEEAKPNSDALWRNITALVALSLIALFNARLHWWDIPPIPPQQDAEGMSLSDRGITQDLFTELGTAVCKPGLAEPCHTSKIIETRWNAFARTDVVEDKTQPGILYVYTNGNVPTNMILWNGKMNVIGQITSAFRLNDWVFSQAPLGQESKTKKGKVLSIGPGGGLDALLALRYNAEYFDGAEINPSIVGLMHDYRRYNGAIYERPDVHVVTAEGRAYVREAIAQQKHYSLIYSALTKTATAGQGMALLESYIYTKDAFHDYLNALDDNGQLVIVCDQPLLAIRVFVTAIATFKERGVSEADARNHIAVIYNPQPGTPYVFSVTIQKSVLTAKQCDAMMTAALQRKLEPEWIPNQAAREDFRDIEQQNLTIDQVIANFRQFQPPRDISPCPDNRPFVLDLSTTQLPYIAQLLWLTIIIAVVLAAAGWRDTRQANAAPVTSEDLLFSLYFFALGIGFMLLEIPLTQKLILPMGYPTLSLTVILFSILLGGGIGAGVSQLFSGKALRSWAIGSAFLVSGVTIILLPVLDSLHITLLHMPLVSRCLAVAALLLPVGFLLGAPFPSGMRLFSERRGEFVPLVWGMNGVSSVIGSLCAAMGARAWGFNDTLRIGALVYLIAAGLVYAATQQKRESNAVTTIEE